MRHKVVACGAILASYVENGQICHELTSLSIQRTVRKHNVSVSLCVPTVPESPRNSWAARKALRIKKVILGKHDTPFSEVIDELTAFYDERGRRLVAACLQLDGGQKQQRQETWTNPLAAEALARMEKARAKANEASENNAARRFWKKTLLLEELDVGLCFETL